MVNHLLCLALALARQNGQTLQETLVVQVNAAQQVQVISSAANATYPAPTWGFRDCMDGGACSQRGACQDDGSCDCDEGFINIDYLCVVVPEENRNLNPTWLKDLGVFLFSFNAVLSCGAVAWTWRYRRSRVVKCSQPHFLALTSLGCLICSSSILVLLVDEQGYFFNVQPSTMSCTLVPWLYAIGFSLCFSSFLAKVVRIQVRTKGERPGEAGGGGIRGGGWTGGKRPAAHDLAPC